MRRYLWIIASAVLLGACTAAESGKGETLMKVEVTNRDGWVYAQWEACEKECLYEVSLFESGRSSAFDQEETAGTTLGLTDRIAWYYQDQLHSDSTAHPMDLSVKVQALKDGKNIASGESEPIRLTDLFPPEEAPKIGTDVLRENITLFEWSSSGSSTELIYNYYVSFDPENPVYSLSYFGESGHVEKETEPDSDFREALLDIILQGELYRDYVMDPEMEILDGSEEDLRIEWKHMKDSEKRFYRLKFSDETRAKLLDLLRGEN